MPEESQRTEESDAQLGDYEIHRAWEGFSSIRQRSSGEIMHSRLAPMAEAESLYVDQSDFVGRIKDAGAGVTLWDMGLGAAANSMAAILRYEREAASGPVTPLQIVSFENDLDSLRLALAHAEDFPYLKHEAPATLLSTGQWQSPKFPGLRWSLVEGDFRETMKAVSPPPDLIFYDMFSSACDSGVWEFRTFQDLFDRCAGHATELITYTRSTANRATLLAAGFFVASGTATGIKEETTIALTPEALVNERATRLKLLDQDWLARWRRSTAKHPRSLPSDQQSDFEKRILGHPQFRAPA